MDIQEESQRRVTGVMIINVVSFHDNKDRGNLNIECDFCHKKGDTKDKSYAKDCEFC